MVGEKRKGRREVVERRVFFVVGSSLCVRGFYENLEIKYARVAFHGVV